MDNPAQRMNQDKALTILRLVLVAFGVIYGAAETAAFFSAITEPFRHWIYVASLLMSIALLISWPLLVLGTYRPRIGGFFLFTVAVLAVGIRVVFQDFKFVWHGGDLTIGVVPSKELGYFFPAAVAGAVLFAISFTRWKSSLSNVWVQALIILGYLALSRFVVVQTIWPGARMYTWTVVEPKWTFFFFGPLLLLLGSALSFRDARFARWLILGGIVSTVSVIVPLSDPGGYWGGAHTIFFDGPRFTYEPHLAYVLRIALPMIFLGFSFLVLARVAESKSPQHAKALLWTVATLCVVIIVAYLGWSQLKRSWRMGATIEARTTIRMMGDAEITYVEKNKTYFAIPKNVEDVPKGNCLPLNAVSPAFSEAFQKMGLKIHTVATENGAPCFRYRYQVITCPGSKECSEGPFSGLPYTMFAILRVEGDLDGNGITSLFEATCPYDEKTGMPGQCFDGMYSERPLE